MVGNNSHLPPKFRGLSPCENSRHLVVHWYIPSRLSKLLHFDPPTSYNKDSSIASDESLWIFEAKFTSFWHATQPRLSSNMKSYQFWGAPDQELLYSWLNGPTNQSYGAWSECGSRNSPWSFWQHTVDESHHRLLDFGSKLCHLVQISILLLRNNFWLATRTYI